MCARRLWSGSRYSETQWRLDFWLLRWWREDDATGSALSSTSALAAATWYRFAKRRRPSGGPSLSPWQASGASRLGRPVAAAPSHRECANAGKLRGALSFELAESLICTHTHTCWRLCAKLNTILLRCAMLIRRCANGGGFAIDLAASLSAQSKAQHFSRVRGSNRVRKLRFGFQPRRRRACAAQSAACK